MSPSPDFESGASANSTTSAYVFVKIRGFAYLLYYISTQFLDLQSKISKNNQKGIDLSLSMLYNGTKLD